MSQRPGPMHVRLTDDRRARMLQALQQWFADEWDETLSDFRADALLDFMVRELGPPVYNQAVRDVRTHLQQRLDDLDVEFYEPETP